MRFWILVLLLFLFSSSQAEISACENVSKDIHGQWQFYKFIYQGQENPPPNPQLKLNFQFFSTGTSRLWWTRDNIDGFCERIGHYEFNDCLLKDEVLWVNPRNNLDCGQDPDMRVGHKATTKAEVINDEFYLYLDLSGEPLTYVWKKINPTSDENKSQRNNN